MSDADILRRIQAEQRPWVIHNFGNRPPWMPLLGIVEEAGELVEADRQRDLNAIGDALADIMIFSLDYCSGMGWDAGDIWRSDPPVLQAGFVGIMINLGRLCHAHLKDAQGIRVGEDHKKAGRLALEGLFACLRHKDPNLVERTVQTWQTVRKRDWKADPVQAKSAEPKTDSYELSKTTLAKAQALVDLDEKGPVATPSKVETTAVVATVSESAPTPPSKEPDPEPQNEDTLEDFLGTLDLR